MELIDKLTEIVENSESFKKIMADGLVEDREVEEQAQLVGKLFEELEQKLSPDDFELAARAMAELSVLHAVYSYNRAYAQIER